MDQDALTPFDSYSLQRRKNRFAAVFWMPVMNLATFVGLPVYGYLHGVNAAHAGLFLMLFLASSMAITMGYHRLFAHATFKTDRPIEFLLLFFGAGAYEESALKWARKYCHRYVASAGDHKPKGKKAVQKWRKKGYRAGCRTFCAAACHHDESGRAAAAVF